MPARDVSIFNDVLGPVMRGPSSSHTAASVRIGLVARALLNGDPLAAATVTYDPHGSLATTAGPQGSNIGLAAGLLGISPEDDRVVDALRIIAEPRDGAPGIAFTTQVKDVPHAVHPNTYRIQLAARSGRQHLLIALSVGGGVIDLVSADTVQLPPSVRRGDRHWAWVQCADPGAAAAAASALSLAASANGWLGAGTATTGAVAAGAAVGADGSPLVGVDPAEVPTHQCCYAWVDSCHPLEPAAVAAACRADASAVTVFPCVMPVSRPADVSLPFASTAEMQRWVEAAAERSEMPLSELAVAYECARGGCSREDVLRKAEHLADLYGQGVAHGLAGTRYHDRVLPSQSPGYVSRLGEERSPMLDLGVGNEIVACTTAYMEVKSSFGLIIAGPTAGSCGALPGAVVGLSRRLELPLATQARGLLAAGLIGALIATHSTFAAEEGGCQAECGAAGAMSAAALVEMRGGSARAAIAAASMTLQSLLGMVCDMIANRVEAPCLYRNVAAVSMAASSANMALSGFASVLPFDEVLAAHWEVARALPRSLRCTGLGGLAAQPSARRLEAEMERRSGAASAGCGSCSCGSRSAGGDSDGAVGCGPAQW
eukprot:TRINITY_DN66088_c0_g1_i1.p1 TRINITY_DN66088_c0_g1~~TRINITY_DN66088_c0_g1_i1.p1  ORF type:complete len:627 (+),score=154.11 TRINITY_DN66088_c0_g1_i1:81-1883(+)